MNRKKLQKTGGKNQFTVTVIAQHQKGYTESQGAIFKIMGTAIFSYKNTHLQKCPLVALDEIEVNNYVLTQLLSVRTQKPPIQIQNGYCHLVRLGI